MEALDQIAIEALGSENQADAAHAELLNQNEPPPPDPALAWAQIPSMFGGMLAIAMPELKGAYTEQACMQWGGAMAQVANKYGWDAAETMSKWAPEIALVLATLPLALPTVAAIKKRTKKPEKDKAEEITLVNEAQSTATADAVPAGGGFVEPT